MEKTYVIERKHRTRGKKWQAVGEFIEGEPWRDGRVVSDETMREEVKGYRRTWTDYEARVVRPNGSILREDIDIEVPDLVQRWLEKELRNVRYWCVAGPAGTGWREHNLQDKPAYEARRNWIEGVLGVSIDSDPWKDSRESDH